MDGGGQNEEKHNQSLNVKPGTAAGKREKHVSEQIDAWRICFSQLAGERLGRGGIYFTAMTGPGTPPGRRVQMLSSPLHRWQH